MKWQQMMLQYESSRVEQHHEGYRGERQAAGAG